MIPSTVVLDTSVFLAALHFKGKGGKLPSPSEATLWRWMAKQFDVVTSRQLIEELLRKLLQYGVSTPTAKAYVATIVNMASDHYDVEEMSAQFPIHSGDRFLVGLGIASHSWCVVSQDNHLTSRWCGCPPGWNPVTFLREVRIALGEAPLTPP